MNNSDYASELLCHFVGRSLATDEEKYKLLLKILKVDRKLYANFKDPKSPDLLAHLSMNYKGENQGEMFNQCNCVCFCDIPDSSLDIHRQKYSSFGMGFKKSYLIGKGTRPVMYVPQSTQIVEYLNTKTPKDPKDYYITLEHQATSVTSLLMMLDQQYSFKRLLDQIYEIATPDLIDTVNDFVLKPIADNLKEQPVRNLIVYLYAAWMTNCAYIKVYDDTLPDNDINNYYMEREWRCLTSVGFSLPDVNTIYLLNKEYEQRFRRDMPEYSGRVYCFEK